MHARHGTGVTVKGQLTGASSLPFCHVSPGIELRLSGLVAGAFDTKPAEALKLFQVHLQGKGLLRKDMLQIIILNKIITFL